MMMFHTRCHLPRGHATMACHNYTRARRSESLISLRGTCLVALGLHYSVSPGAESTSSPSYPQSGTPQSEPEEGQGCISLDNSALKTQQPSNPGAQQEQQQPLAVASMDIDASDYDPPNFPLRRLLCFAGITVGYMGLYFTRGSLTYCAPVMLIDPSLSMNITDIGAMTSAFPLAYGFSKFAGGVLGAKISARLMLGGGLLITALINITFGFAHSVTAFTALWFLNGSLQGIGAPASASLLTRWFASKERGTYWGLWNTGANVGGFLTPLIVGWFANHYGWQWGMWVPGMMGLSIALFCLAAVSDSPLEAGYRVVQHPNSSESQRPQVAEEGPVSQQQPLHSAMELRQRRNEDGSSSTGPDGVSFDGRGSALPQRSIAKGSDEPSSPQRAPLGNSSAGNSAIKKALAEVVRNPGTWLLALTYFFVYIVRQGATSWLMMYLMQAKGVENAAQAAVTMSGLEVGGLIGGTLAGVLSDARIRSSSSPAQEGVGGSSGGVGADKRGDVGKRVQIVMAYIGCTLLVLCALRSMPPGEQVVHWVTIAALGFTIYGPHMLIGLCGAELVPKSAVGASQGVLGLVAYMGAANAGIPLAYVLKHHGWEGYFTAMSAACVVALMLLLPLANAQSHNQKKAALMS